MGVPAFFSHGFRLPRKKLKAIITAVNTEANLFDLNSPIFLPAFKLSLSLTCQPQRPT